MSNDQNIMSIGPIMTSSSRSWRLPTVTFTVFIIIVTICGIVLIFSHETIQRHLIGQLERDRETTLHRAIFHTDRTVDQLQKHYYQCCGRNISNNLIRDAVSAMSAQPDIKHGVIQFGNEMWNRFSLHETVNRFRYYEGGQHPLDPIMFVLAYGNRLDQGRQLMDRISAGSQVDYVSYRDIKTAYDNRHYLSEKLFRSAVDMTWDEFTSRFPPNTKQAGYLLSTLNQWMIFENLNNAVYPDEIIVVEDDVMTVPDFQRKLNSIRTQLQTIPDWEMVFLGTCFQISSEIQVTANLYEANTTRCFNGVMLRRSVATKVLGLGAITDTFLPVDFLFNTYIPLLGIKAYFAEPPLMFEQSKVITQYPC